VTVPPASPEIAITHSPARRQLLLSTLAGAAVVAAPSLASAQAFPSRTIRLIYPWTAGSGGDVIIRALAASASRTLGTSIIIENKPGAGGMLGPNELVKAAPDGYTLSQLSVAIFRQPHMQKTAFDPLQDFSYIIGLAGFVFGLVVPTESPIKTVKDLVEYAKANPGKFSYATSGIGITGHLAMEEFGRLAGIQMMHVPFKGDTEGLHAMLSGQVMAHSSASTWAPHVDAGKARLIMTCGSRRTTRWPTVPTLRESGYDFVTDSPWGIGGPKGMDPAIVKQLHDAFLLGLKDPQVTALLDKYDQPLIHMDPAQYTRFAREAFQQEKAVITRLGLNKA
jgi:tripartite-type tricarboxylate transporter receptor subunit TctC